MMNGGSIPAHAGEPKERRGAGCRGRVYPPPTRGNHWAEVRSSGRPGSIPAHAGEPCCRCSGSCFHAVYPRPRGGTSTCRHSSPTASGLSPPTRGNLVWGVWHPHRHGSIPAHAGEPITDRDRLPFLRVYPRPRGGTGDRAGVRVRAGGLSPPTRGNQSRYREATEPAGSIPAHAGEPCRRRLHRRA